MEQFGCKIVTRSAELAAKPSLFGCHQIFDIFGSSYPYSKSDRGQRTGDIHKSLLPPALEPFPVRNPGEGYF
jgi:hypothetical protein